MYLTVEDSAGQSIDGVIWSDQLAVLEADGRVPAVGHVTGLVATLRTRKVMVEVPSDDPDNPEPVVEVRSRRELSVLDCWTEPLDDPPTPAGLAATPVPACNGETAMDRRRRKQQHRTRPAGASDGSRQGEATILPMASPERPPWPGAWAPEVPDPTGCPGGGTDEPVAVSVHT